MALVSDLHIGTQLSGSVLGFIVIRIWNQDLTFFTKNNQENLPFFKSSMENVARKANVEKGKNDKKIYIKKSFCFLAFYPLGSGSRRTSITRIRTQNTGTVFVLRYTVLFTQCTCAITTQKGRTYEIFLYFVRR